MRILYLPNQDSQQRQHEYKRWIYPIRLAMEAEWYRVNHPDYFVDFDPDPRFPYRDPKGYFDKIITKPEGLPFLSLPHPDRDFTRAKDPKYQRNGNFKHHPGTYILSASGCPWHKCRFCVESLERYKIREVNDVLSEIEECKSEGFREIFDDASSLPTDGEWLEKLCDGVKSIGVSISGNFRAVDADYARMADSGFRMLLFGLESANQHTLDKIRKGVRIENAIKAVIKASLSGIECHIAVMFGYPWETDTEAVNTLRLVRYMLRKGYAKTAQASFYSPQAETASGQKREVGKEAHRKYVRKIYGGVLHPEFIYNQLKSVRNADDIKYLWKGVKACLNRS